MKRIYDGAAAGTGASYAWAGNKKVGEGRMTITDSMPAKLVRIRLEFLKPFAATNTAEFTFTPRDSQTHTSWAMSGRKIFMLKLFCLFMNMDKMIGKDFEKGLNKLKSVAEKAARS